MTTDTAVLATACINQPALAGRPARVLLVGAATLRIFYRFGTLGFDLRPPELRQSFGFRLTDVNRIKAALADVVPMLCEEWRTIHGDY